MNLSPRVLTLLAGLWLPLCALAAEPALSLQSEEALKAELLAQRSRALRSDLCRLGPTLQSVCGQPAGEALDSICASSTLPQPETLKALAPFLAGPSQRACPEGTLVALQQEATRQKALPKSHDTTESIEGESSVSGTARSGVSLPLSTDFQGMLLDGLTTLLLERARVESIAYVLDEVSEKLCKEPAKDKPLLSARSLFPLTCNLVTGARESGMLLIPGPMLHRTLSEDLQNLPARLAAALPPGGKEQALVFCSLTVSQGFGRGLLSKRPPVQLVVGALRAMAKEPSCQQALGLPSTGLSLRWQSLVQAVEAAATLLQEADADTLRRWAREPKLLLNLLEPVLEPSIAEQLRAVLNDILPLALQAELAVTALRATEPGSEAQRAAFLEVVRSSMALLSAVVQAGVQLEPLQDSASIQLRLQSVQQAVEATADLFSGDFAGGLTRLVSSQLIPIEQEPFKTMFQFSPLLVSLGSAKTSEEMAAAFEAAAAPVGSWRLKRQKTTLGLGARVGAIVSQESILADSGQVPDGLTLGPWLPVGLDASVPAFGGKHTFGLLLQLVDLGGIANARLSTRTRTVEGTTVEPQVAPTLGFVQVVSPGVSLYWGIGHTPFVLSAGVSTAPALRSATFRTGEAEEEKDYNVLRTSLSLSVDIPLYIR